MTVIVNNSLVQPMQSWINKYPATISYFQVEIVQYFQLQFFRKTRIHDQTKLNIGRKKQLQLSQI